MAAGGDKGKYEVYLMRHGIAADCDPSGSSDDAKRPLTAEGKTKLRASAKGLMRLRVKWDWVVTSPLKRSIETADAVLDEMRSSAPRDICEALAPQGVDSRAQKVMAFLAQHPGRSRVLLVGHEPSLSTLASELIGGRRDARFIFKKGGCCLVRFDDPQKSTGALAWWLTPRLLRKIGG